MSTPFDYIDNTGIIQADTSDILTEVEGEWQTVYGADLSVTNDTPQGKMIVAETASRVSLIMILAQLANQINPNFAGGIFLDALCAFLGLTREPATFTVVPGVTVAGTPLITIPAGAQAKGTSTGAFFASTQAVTLDINGNGTVDFQAVLSGPTPCPIGDLSKISTDILGWETVNNTVAPNTTQVGQLQQSDESLRALRNQTLALQGISTPEAQTSGLAAVPGVLSFKYQENDQATQQTINGIVMKPNSVWACVDGGTDADIATSLRTNKTDGAGWNGAEVVTVTDPFSGQVVTINFDRTVAIPCICRVTIRIGTSTADPTSAVPQAVQDYAAGLIANFVGLVTGAPCNPFEISAGISNELVGMIIAKVEVATVAAGSGAFSTNELPITLQQKATIIAGSVTVLIVT